MSDSEANALDEALTVRDHLDADKHYIGEALPAPSVSEMPGGIGTVNSTGTSVKPARADHAHAIGNLFNLTIDPVAGNALTVNQVTNNAAIVVKSDTPFGAGRTAAILFMDGDGSPLYGQIGGQEGAGLFMQVLDTSDLIRFLDHNSNQIMSIEDTHIGTDKPIRTRASGVASIRVARTDVNNPYIDFTDSTFTTRYGYVQGTATAMNIVSDAGDITLNSGGGQVRTSDAIYCTGAGRFFSAGGNQVIAAGTTDRAYIGFYPNATNSDTLGTRSGWVGFASSTNMSITNEQSTVLTFIMSGAERVRISGDVMIFGKTAADTTTQGAYINGASGQWVGVDNVENSANIFLNRLSGNAILAGEQYATFRRAGSQIGRIEIAAVTSNVSYVTSSTILDKEEIRPVPDLQALKMMRDIEPVLYKDKNSGIQSLGYVAEHVAQRAPLAINAGIVCMGDGSDENRPGMDYGKMTPILHSAMQAQDRIIKALEARISALEAA